MLTDVNAIKQNVLREIDILREEYNVNYRKNASVKDKIDSLKSVLMYLDHPNSVSLIKAQYDELIRKKEAIEKEQDKASVYYGFSSQKIILRERDRVARQLGLDGISYKILVIEKILFNQ